MRDVLFVLGMHRSGTSAVTRLCSLLGAQLPNTLMGANAGNPKGHWESDVLVSYNDQLLEKEGYNWFDIPSWAKLRSIGQAHIYDTPDLLEQLESEYSNKKDNITSILIKDPRISLFLPEYENVITQSNNYGEIKAIICLRSPLEVANSIYKRDQLDKISAQMVWLIYMLYAERSSRHLNRVFIKYADLFSGSPYEFFIQHTASLDVKWLNESELTKQSVDQFITPELYRQKSKNENSVMIPLVDKAYSAFLNLANNQDVSRSYKDLDEIFDTLEPILRALSSVRETMFRTLKQSKKRLGSSEKEKALSDAALKDLKEQYKKLEKLTQLRVEEVTQNMASAFLKLEHTSSSLAKANNQIETLLQSEADLKHAISDLENQKKLLEEIKNAEVKTIQEEFSQTLKGTQNNLTAQVSKFESLEKDYRKLEKKYLDQDKSFISLELAYRQLETLFSTAKERIAAQEMKLEHKTISYKQLMDELGVVKALSEEKLLAKDMQIDWLETEQDNITQSQSRTSFELEETQAYARDQHAQIDMLTQKLASTEETIKSMQASRFWKLRNLLSFGTKDFKFSSTGSSTYLKPDNDLTSKAEPKTIKDWLNENEPDGWIEGADEEFRFSLDNLELIDGVQHLWGWAFDVFARVNSVEIIGLDSSFNVHIRKAESNKMREDVEAVFGGKNARMSGFSFLGSCADPMEDKPAEMAILFRLDNKENRLISLIDTPEKDVSKESVPVDSNWSKRRWNFEKAASLLKSGEIDKLFGGVSRVLGRGFKQIDISVDEDKAVKMAQDYLVNGAELVFDHALGGGCNAYSKTRIGDLVSNKNGAVVLSYSVQNLSPTLKIMGPNDVVEEFFIKDIIGCLRQLSPDVRSIFINNLVSFPKPELLIETLTNLVEEHSIHLSIAFHEHYAICPSHFLLNAEGRFCDIPEVDVCKSCLYRNPYGFTSLAESQDVEIWRQKWSRLFFNASHLLFFSQATLDLVSRAFPSLNKEKVNVIPHQVVLDTWTAIEPDYSTGLKIGVVGFLSHHKGSEVIQNLALEIDARKLVIKIHIIGNIDGNSHSLIETTGPYKHEQLPKLIKDSGANIFIMPSIVPETFSYVTAELMALNLPIISFDFGAPAERLRTYDLGETMQHGNAAQILDSVLEFYHTIKNR